MPRRSEPRWIDKRGCYRYRFRGRDHYSTTWRGVGIAKPDRAAVAEWVEAIHRAEDAARLRALAGAGPTVEQVCAWFLVWQAGQHAYRTVAGHEFILTRWCDFAGPDGVAYGDRPAASVEAGDLTRMARAWRAAGYSEGYVAQLYKSVCACWAWAARPEPDRADADGGRLPERLVPRDPFGSTADGKGLRRPRTRSRADRYASREEIADFLRHARRELAAPFPADRRGRCLWCQRGGWPGREAACERNHAPTPERLRDVLTMIRLAAWAGVRPGELCDATWSGWTPAAAVDGLGRAIGRLKVPHKNQRYTGELRTVVVPPRLARAIERIRARPWAHPTHLFAHSRGRGGEARGADDRGEPWNTQALDRRVRQWRDGAIAWATSRGLEPRVRPTFTPYCLRHAFYTEASAVLGAQLAGRLGGSSERVVEAVYVKRRDDALVDAALAVEAARRGRGVSRRRGG